METSFSAKLLGALLGLSLLHCVSASDSASSRTAATDFPADSSRAGIEAFIAAGSYKTSSWISESSAPRAANSVVSPHGRVRVWLNAVLKASQAAGKGSVGGAPLDQNSMSVKELYDDKDAIVGYAVMIQTGTTATETGTTYYCTGPNSRCPGTSPVYGAGAATCAGCHDGLIFNGMPQ